jgi:membrane-associated phospholipid phosphatase
MQTAKSSVSHRPAHLALLACLLLGQHAGSAFAGEDSETAGDVLRVAIPAAAYALTFTRDDREGRRQFYKSFATSVASTWVLKETVEKERPDGSGDDAFPSGHTSAAFQGAAFIHRRYGIRSAWPAYVLATYTGWTRVDSDKHDAADVLAGAALGIGSSFIFTKRRDVSVSAMLEPDGFGIRITGRF